jgi:hypothetical protein
VVQVIVLEMLNYGSEKKGRKIYVVFVDINCHQLNTVNNNNFLVHKGYL